MTEFKITPEDVGRVAVEENSDGKFTVIAESGGRFFVQWESSLGWNDPALNFNHAVVDADGKGFDNEGDELHLSHWKPRTLKAPKYWWNVYRHVGGTLDAVKYVRYDMAKSAAVNHIIARVYAGHWDGCEEGVFETPESIGTTS